MIDVGDWLASRTPPPPLELADRLAGMVGRRACADSTALVELLVSEAAVLLENLQDDRTSAVDLLVADALVTYAMEAAAEDHDKIDDLAAHVMHLLGGSAHRGGNA